MEPVQPTRPAKSFGLAIAGTIVHVGLLMAIFALYAFVVPATKKLFDEFGLTLPWLTLEVIRLSNWIAAYWWALVPAMLILGGVDFGAIVLLSTKIRVAAILWIACVSLILTFAIVLTVVAIEHPRAKLKEGLTR